MCPGRTIVNLVEPMEFESASRMETKEFCGAPWPSTVLKGKATGMIMAAKLRR